MKWSTVLFLLLAAFVKNALPAGSMVGGMTGLWYLPIKETVMYPFCVDFLEMHMEMDRLIDPEGSALGRNGFHMQCTYVKVAAAFALPCTQSRNLAPLSITKLGLEHWAFLQHYGLVNARSAINTVTPRVFGTSQVIIFGFHHSTGYRSFWSVLLIYCTGGFLFSWRIWGCFAAGDSARHVWRCDFSFDFCSFGWSQVDGWNVMTEYETDASKFAVNQWKYHCRFAEVSGLALPAGNELGGLILARGSTCHWWKGYTGYTVYISQHQPSWIWQNDWVGVWFITTVARLSQDGVISHFFL